MANKSQPQKPQIPSPSPGWPAHRSHHVNIKFLEADYFNFNQWIKDSGLKDMRNIFMKHKMTTVQALSPQSDSFKKFISDPQLFREYSSLITTAVSAIQKVSESYIVISEDENLIIERMKFWHEEFKKTESELNELKRRYPQSIQQIKDKKLKQIKETRQNIDDTFERLRKSFEPKKKELKHVLRALDDEKQVIHGENDDDGKEMDLLKESQRKIDNANNILIKHFNEFKDKIKTETISNRKNSISQINKETVDKCEKIQNQLKENMERIKRMIVKNNDIHINIAFVLNDQVYNKILSKIDKIGLIVNEEYASSKDKANQAIIQKDEDDEMIKKLRKEVDGKNDEIRRLKHEIDQKQDDINKLQKDKESIDKERAQFSAERRQNNEFQESIISRLTLNGNNESNDDDYRWVHEINDDEKEYKISLCQMFADKQRLIDCHGSIEPNDFKRNVSRTPLDNHSIAQCVDVLKQNAIRFLKQFKIEMLPFSAEYISDRGYFELSDDRNVIKRTSLLGFAYVVCDIEPVTTGVHCWRVKITNSMYYNCWIMFGVSKKRTFQDMSWEDGAYGVSCCGGQYFAYDVDSNNVDTSHLHNAEHVDILLDADNGEMGICEVGYRRSCLGNRKEARLWNLPASNSAGGISGWVPHFNICKAGIELRVAKIPISFYGKKNPNIF